MNNHTNTIVPTTDTISLTVSSSTSSSTAPANFSTSTTSIRYPTETLQPHVQTILQNTQAVCFDVDSTVITVEGIDEFAAFSGKKEEVAALTKA